MAKNTFGTKLPRKLEQKMKIVGEQIKMARLRRNLTMEQIAERATCSVLTLARIEKGAPTVSIGIYVRVLYALQLEDDILLLAQEDKLGRALQDLHLKERHRASKTCHSAPRPKPLKIQYASDLHLEFKENSQYLKENPLQVVGDVLVLAGDVGCLGDDNYSRHPFWDWASENFWQVIVALGNHEFYKGYDVATIHDGFELEIRPNVHAYYNKVVNIDGVDIIVSTLWARIHPADEYYTERSVSDFFRIRYKGHRFNSDNFNAEHHRCLSFIQKAVANSTARAKVVVTHHVPSFALSSSDFEGSPINGAFTVELGNYIATSGIDYWIYGHSHRNIAATIGSTRCLSNQLGYVSHYEHTTFNPAATIEI